MEPPDTTSSLALADKPPSLETIAKGAAAAVVGCYTAGLLTVSSYLYRNGVSLADPSALRARFVYTGAGILLIVAASVGFFLIGLGIARGRAVRPRIQFRQARTDGPKLRRSLGMRYVAGAFAVSLVPFGALVAMLRWVGGVSFFDASLYGHSVVLWLWAVVGGVAALAALTALFGAAPSQVQHKVPRWMAVLALSAYGLVFLAGFTAIVSSYLYPLIPEQFGGGRPRTVRLLLSQEGAKVAPKLGVSVPSSRTASRRVSLIWEDSDYVAVRTKEQGVVQLNKALVLGAQPE